MAVAIVSKGKILSVLTKDLEWRKVSVSCGNRPSA